MKVQVYEVDNGDCPYLSDRQWITHSFSVSQMPADLYEELLVTGWRRSGMSFYQNHCPGCNCCTQTRVPVAEFRPSKSQRRVRNRNSDVTVSVHVPTADEETLELYSRYVKERHPRMDSGAGSETPEPPEQFSRFLVESPVPTVAMHYRVEDRLVGIGWIDVLENGISSVYFAFDPADGSRSLGTYSFLKEIEYARGLGKEWLYLGFYVPGSAKMAYKGRFRPREFAIDGHWTGDEKQIKC